MTLMIYRFVIISSLLFPVTLGAQLQLDSKQVVESVSYLQSPSLDINAEIDLMSNTPSSADKASNTNSILLYGNTSVIPAYKPRHYGVFCRIESKIEKKSNISPRFRLGSSAYVDMLEGKGVEESRSEGIKE